MPCKNMASNIRNGSDQAIGTASRTGRSETCPTANTTNRRGEWKPALVGPRPNTIVGYGRFSD